jgi:hypothetical protein
MGAHIHIQVDDWLRFPSDSQRESRHRFDETINNNGRRAAGLVLLETSVQEFFFLPPVDVLIDRARLHPLVINSAGLLYNELKVLMCINHGAIKRCRL